ncbi:DUF86 domain-containing protein [Candidatus Margulisiibacteriota bacterium]
MKKKLGDKLRVQHILKAIDEINDYIQNQTYDDFDKKSMFRNATLKQLEIIGEAANNISNNIKNLYPDIEWREMVDFRNFSIHEYFDIDPRIVWDIITIDLNNLKSKIQKILTGF